MRYEYEKKYLISLSWRREYPYNVHMRILIQECLSARVTVEGKVVGEISSGEVVFISFTQGDDESILDKMLDKMLKLRIFSDEHGKTNLNLDDHGGEILCVSQFTLYADLSKGNRPSFIHALKGEEAKRLYDLFTKKLLERKPKTQFGIFGADMKVSLVNDGPFTIWLDSKEILKKDE